MKVDDNKKIEEIKNNVTNIDKKRIERLEQNGHYPTLIEQFDTLHAKFFYANNMSTREGHLFLTLCKYFEKNGHTEALRLRCKFLLDKYTKGNGL